MSILDKRDTRDYQVLQRRCKKTTKAVIVKGSLSLDVEELCEKFDLKEGTVRRRLRAMVCWDDLVSKQKGRTYEMIMPTIKDVLTGYVNWAAFEDRRDYKIIKKPQKGGGNKFLLIEYQGKTEVLNDVAKRFGVAYATVRKRIESGRSYDEVFSQDRLENVSSDSEPVDIGEVEVRVSDWALDAVRSGTEGLTAVRNISLFLCGKSAVFPAVVSDYDSEPMVVGGGV